MIYYKNIHIKSKQLIQPFVMLCCYGFQIQLTKDGDTDCFRHSFTSQILRHTSVVRHILLSSN